MQIQSMDSNATKASKFQALRRRIRKLKILILVILSVVFLIYRILLHISQNQCIIDQYQNATQPLNRMFVESQGSSYEGASNQLTIGGKVFIGIGQILMDVWVGFVGLMWLFKTSNMRSFFAMGIFYLIRAILYLNIQKFPFPDNMAWRNPGFFSFVVPYEHTRDFFYSGHTGGILIATFEAFQLNLNKIGVLALVSAVYMMNMLIVTRVHYVIDVIAGIIFAFWSYRLSRRYLIYFDKLLNLPYALFLWLKKRYSASSEPHAVSSQLEKEANISKESKQSQMANIKQIGILEKQHNKFQILIDELNEHFNDPNDREN